MNNIIKIIDISVRQDSEGRLCLNDLHKAAGGEKRHQPSNWLRMDETKELIAKIDKSVPQIRGTKQNQSVKIIYGGNPENQGTYIAKELVYDYAMWISPEFKLKVIRSYDAQFTKPKTPEQLYKNLARTLRTALPGLKITDQAVLLSKDAGDKNFSGETREQSQYFKKMDAYGLPGIIVMDKKPYKVWFDWLSQDCNHPKELTESIYKELWNYCRGRGLKGMLLLGYTKKLEPFQIRGNFEEITGFKSHEEARLLAENLAKIVSSRLAAKTSLPALQ